jgi:DNA-binding protein YbaB
MNVDCYAPRVYRSYEDADSPLAKVQQEIRDLVADSSQPREGVGTAAEGMVRVTVQSGRIGAVELDSRAMRLPTSELAEAFAEAANAALADLEAKYPAVAMPAIDLEALQQQLEDAENQGLRQMKRYLDEISEARS